MELIPKEDRLIVLDVVDDQIKNYLLKTPIKYYDVPDSIRKQYGGAFVTLYVDDKLRGCMGIVREDMTLFNILKDVSWKACIDPRFSRITQEEVMRVVATVSVLSNRALIDNIDEIKIGAHGIVVEGKQNSRTGVYLPEVAVQQKWSAEEFVHHCALEKAGIEPFPLSETILKQDFNIYTFETDLIT